jgi:SP family myo-inositol transporter-like MFS transporter 13
MFADILFTCGAMVMAFAPTIPILMIGRVLVGLGVGIAAQIVPLYLSEVAPIEIRGKLIAINTALITGGQLFSVILVFILRPHWRTMLGLSGVPSTL